MDTKTLVVGQKVLLESGVYCNAGTVVEVRPNGVDVRDGLLQEHPRNEILYFDNEGCSYITESSPSYDPFAYSLSTPRWDGNGTFECGPWYIVALVSDEEIASWKDAAARKDGSAAQLWKDYTTRILRAAER